MVACVRLYLVGFNVMPLNSLLLYFHYIIASHSLLSEKADLAGVILMLLCFCVAPFVCERSGEKKNLYKRGTDYVWNKCTRAFREKG